MVLSTISEILATEVIFPELLQPIVQKNQYFYDLKREGVHVEKNNHAFDIYKKIFPEYTFTFTDVITEELFNSHKCFYY